MYVLQLTSTRYDVWETSRYMWFLYLFLYNIYSFLILEHLGGGELFDYLKERTTLDQNVALKLFQELVFGIEYCHSHFIWYKYLAFPFLITQSSRP